MAAGSHLLKPAFAAALAACLAALLAAGCRTAAPTSQPPHQLPKPKPSATAAASPWPRVAVDDLGQRVVLQSPPRRIVSLSPSTTEVVAALGALDRLVGRTDFCDFPPQVKSIPSIGGIINPSFEKVVALKPDLVLAAHGNDPAFLRKLRSAGIPVFGLNPRSVSEAFAQLERVGYLLGLEDVGRAKHQQLKRRTDLLSARARKILGSASRPTAVVVISIDPLFVAGGGTFIDELLSLACMKNAAGSDRPWPQWSAERLVAADPDIIILLRDADGPVRASPKTIRRLASRSAWRSLSAIRSGHVYEIAEDFLTIPGPRLVQGLQRLVEVLDDYVHTAASHTNR